VDQRGFFVSLVAHNHNFKEQVWWETYLKSVDLSNHFGSYGPRSGVLPPCPVAPRKVAEGREWLRRVCGCGRRYVRARAGMAH
jgi:hypothetical protein